MSTHSLDKLVEIVNNAAQPLAEGTGKYDSLLTEIGESRFVLIGEASHGTHEFYQTRMEITRELIEKKGFMAIAIEGDWPDAYNVNRYLQGNGSKEDTDQALSKFKRFPSWMWRNTMMPPFLEWLRNYNDSMPNPNHKTGLYGLDLYSLYASMHEVVDYLSNIDKSACERARKRYACFDHIKPDPQTYGYLVSSGLRKSCVHDAIQQLLEMQHNAFSYLKQDGIAAEDELFYATQNARLVKNAEEYYRSMFESHVLSWNLRDRHMNETLNTLANHLENRFNKPSKIIVWAHNSHVGDARATEMGERGEYNIGQLVKEQHDSDCYSIGFSTYDGTVTAADNWSGPPKRKQVNPGLKGSYEELFHHTNKKCFLLNLRSNKELEHYLQLSRLQRAIGVIYLPESERQSHYFFSRLPFQFESIIHIDRTCALQPLA